MNKMKVITQMVVFLAMGLSLTACAQTTPPTDTGNKTYPKMNENNKVVKTDKEWRALLSDEEYRILREQGTERPFTGDLYNIQDSGMYVCAACGNELFSSEHKFESGSGWPSYWQAANNTNVEETVDKSHGMIRREVHCARCGGHLGHIFEDGPKPTGLRYCINSAAMDFKPTTDSDTIKAVK